MKIKNLAILATLSGVPIFGAAWAVHSGPAPEQVIVLKSNLPRGHILVSSDLAIGTLRASKARASELLPASLAGLVQGEYLVSAGLAGAPLLTSEIHRVNRLVSPPPPLAKGDGCVPAKAI